jgi:hypothetical protein
MRQRSEPLDALDCELRRARRLWEDFVAACNRRDRYLAVGDLARAETAADAMAVLDAQLTETERRIQLLDAVEGRTRGPRARARRKGLSPITQPHGAGAKPPRPALTAERGAEKPS